MNPDINSQAAATFHRTKHLPYYLLFVAVAAAWWLETNTLTAHLALSLLTLLVGTVAALFYAMPKVEFSTDGSIKSYQTVIQPNKLAAIRYFTIQLHFRFFSTRVIALYNVSHNSYNFAIPSQITIPTTGWRKGERQALFSRLDTWLSATNADIDIKTKQRITELATR